MRKTKTIKIDDKEITVKELKVKHIRRFWDQAWSGDMSLDALQDLLGDILPLIAPELKVNDLEEMAPSEIRFLWDTFREVNTDFFAVVRLEDAGQLLTELKKAFLKDLTSLFAGSLNPATQTSGNTDTDSSILQSKSSKKQPQTGSKKSQLP